MKLPGKLTEIIKGAFDNHRWASLAPTGLSLPAMVAAERSLLVKVGSDPEQNSAGPTHHHQPPRPITSHAKYEGLCLHTLAAAYWPSPLPRLTACAESQLDVVDYSQEPLGCMFYVSFVNNL